MKGDPKCEFRSIDNLLINVKAGYMMASAHLNVYFFFCIYQCKHKTMGGGGSLKTSLWPFPLYVTSLIAQFYGFFHLYTEPHSSFGCLLPCLAVKHARRCSWLQQPPLFSGSQPNETPTHKLLLSSDLSGL